MRLNKYLAHAGIANRRKADELIAQGLVKINGEVMKEAGYQVKENEVVTFMDKPVQPGKKVYILLNKPKNFSTEIEGEKNLLQLVKSAAEKAGLEYSINLKTVETADESTLGLCIITNDDNFLAESSLALHRVKKVLKVHLSEELNPKDESKLLEEISAVNQGKKIPKLAFPDEPEMSILGIETYSEHSKVKAIIENKGYSVEKLDVMLIGNITKKDLPRGKWRFLEKKEIDYLKG